MGEVTGDGRRVTGARKARQGIVAACFSLRARPALSLASTGQHARTQPEGCGYSLQSCEMKGNRKRR